MSTDTELVDKEQEQKVEEQEEIKEEDQESTTNEQQQQQNLEKDPIIVKAKSMELPELFDFIKDLDNQYNAYVTGIKAILIRIAAEKLEERGMTAISNIVDEIAERLAGSKIPVTTTHIRRCIPDHLKKSNKARPNNQNNKQQQSKQEQEFKTDEDIEREHINQSSIKPAIAKEELIPSKQRTEMIQEDEQDGFITISTEDYQALKDEIKTLKESKPKNYKDSIQTIRVIKWDKYKVNEIDAAWKNSLKEVYFKVDENGKLIAAITDKQYNKELKEQQKKDTNT